MGLKPLDLVVRCVEGLRSDPLELDPSSIFGPPAFVQALRKHPNLSANAVGTAVLLRALWQSRFAGRLVMASSTDARHARTDSATCSGVCRRPV